MLYLILFLVEICLKEKETPGPLMHMEDVDHSLIRNSEKMERTKPRIKGNA